MSVGDGQDILVDVTASTGTLMFTGNDHDFESELVEEISGESLQASRLSQRSVNDATVSMGVVLFSSGGSTSTLINPVPESIVTLSSITDASTLSCKKW